MKHGNLLKITAIVLLIALCSGTFVPTRVSAFEIENPNINRLITPNNDGDNDFFEIEYKNYGDDEVYGKIYNTRGVLISGMIDDSINETLRWYGNISGNTPAPMGVYIYQIEVRGMENKTISGMLVLIR